MLRLLLKILLKRFIANHVNNPCDNSSQMVDCALTILELLEKGVGNDY